MTADYASPPAAAGDPRWGRNLAAVWFSQLFSMMAFSFCMPFAPYYIQTLGVKGAAAVKLWSGLFVAAASVTLAIMSPVWGGLGDRYGRKAMLLRANLGGSVTLFAMGLVDNVGWLIVMRAFQGMFTGTVPAAQTLVSVSAPPERHGFAMGLLSTALYAGTMAGSFLGGRCADAFGYAETFKIAGGLLFMAALVVILFVQEDFEPPEPTAAATNVSRREHLLALWPLLVVICGTTLAQCFEGALLPLFIQQVLQRMEGAATVTGNLGAVACAASIISGPLTGRLADRWPLGRLGGGICLGAALASLGLAGCRTLDAVYLLFFVQAFFAAGLNPITQVWLGQASRKESRGEIFGWAVTARSLAWMSGPLLSAALAAGWGLTTIFLGKAVIFAAMIFLIGWAARREEASRPPA